MFAGRVRVGTHEMQNGRPVQHRSSTLSSTAHVWCTHVELGGIVWSQNIRFHFSVTAIVHASQTVCQRSAANVLMLMGKTCDFALDL